MKKKQLKKQFSIMTIICMVIMTLNSNLVLANSSSNKDVNPKTMDGEEIFRSIYFLDGDLTEKIYDKKSISESQVDGDEKLEAEKVQKEIVELIEKNNDKFFDEFEAKIKSNNPILVSEAIDESAEELIFSLKEAELLNPEIDSDNIDPAALIVVGAVLVLVVVVAASYGALLHTGLNTALIKANVEVLKNKGSNLNDVGFEREQFVVDIIEGLN